MRYLDTSVVVAALGGEHWSVDIARWVADHSTECVVSAWAGTEYSNVVSRRVRVGQFSDDQQKFALRSFGALVASFGRVDIRDVDFDMASAFVDRADLGLRAPDALHLAVAKRHECEVVTLDKGMSEAARKLDLHTVMMGDTR